jgi:hypothetical protein
MVGERDVLLKQTRNPRLTDTDLQNIMGMTGRTAGYRNLFLFQNRNLPRPYNEPPRTNIINPKPWIYEFYFIMRIIFIFFN